MQTITLNYPDILTEEEKELLKSLVEKTNRRPVLEGVPDIGEMYWYISICQTKWFDTSDDFQRHCIGNVFKTKVDAERRIEQQHILVELQRFADTHNETGIGWNDLKYPKYILGYDREIDKIVIREFTSIQVSTLPFFTSRELAEFAIECVGEERIKLLFQQGDIHVSIQTKI